MPWPGRSEISEERRQRNSYKENAPRQPQIFSPRLFRTITQRSPNDDPKTLAAAAEVIGAIAGRELTQPRPEMAGVTPAAAGC